MTDQSGTPTDIEGECRICRCSMYWPADYEPTEICHQCAHNEVDRLEAELAAAKAQEVSLRQQLDARATIDAQRESYISDLQAELKAVRKAREEAVADLSWHRGLFQQQNKAAESRLATMEGLLREWRNTELDNQDEEFEPWINSFTDRVNGVLNQTAAPSGGRPRLETDSQESPAGGRGVGEDDSTGSGQQ